MLTPEISNHCGYTSRYYPGGDYFLLKGMRSGVLNMCYFRYGGAFDGTKHSHFCPG